MLFWLQFCMVLGINMDFNISHLISKGECEDIEFKQEEVKAKDIAETICAFANKKGGVILFGIEDGTKKLLGIANSEGLIEKIENANRDMLNPMADIDCKVDKHEGKKIVVANVKMGSTLHTAYKTRQIYVRTGMSDSPADVDAMIKILNDRGRFYFEDMPVSGAIYENLDTEKIYQYLNTGQKGKDSRRESKLVLLRIFTFLRKNGKSTQREPKAIFTSLGLLKDDKPTVTAILLFAANPQHFFPSYSINATQLKKDDEGVEAVIKQEIIDGSLCDLVKKGIQFIINASKKFESLQEALREAIVNAVVHRDYSITGAIELKVWDDRAEISSPGGLTGGRTIDDLLTNPMSVTRNPRIARIMSELGFGDNRCRGIYKIRTDVREKAETEAIFREDPFGFAVILYLKIEQEDTGSSDEEIEQGDVYDNSE